MNCIHHPEAEATAYCRQCGTALCPACVRDVRGAIYCENCLANLVGLPASPGATPTASPSALASGMPLPPPAIHGGPNPGIALALGFIPGLGAVYNGEYIKALIHVVAFGGIIALLTTDLPSALYPLLGIGLGCFYCYMPIEAYRTAKAKRGEPLSEGSPAVGASVEGNRPIGAIILIVLGALFLLANFHLLERDWFSKTWPAVLIIIGVYILYDRMKRAA